MIRPSRPLLSLFALAGLVSGVPALAATPASAAAPVVPVLSSSLPTTTAVSHGSVVASPSRTAPWALSLWLEPRTRSGAGTHEVEFLCTATAVSSTVVVTAAHCTKEAGFLYLQVGADSLGQAARFVPVEAVSAHAGYRSTGTVDDIALLRPMTPIVLRSYARLGTPALARSVKAGARAMTVYGWGETETGDVTGRLRAAILRPAASAARQAFGPYYRPATMIAAGVLNTRTRQWTGACPGDSGGPLVTRVGSTTYVVGVTNFGRYDCTTGPTVFASVGDFASWTTATARALPVLAKTRNTALPLPLTAPKITGTVALGSTLTCARGAWSANTRSWRYGWYRGNTLLGTSATHVLTSADAGSSLRCVTAGVSTAGNSSVQTPAVSVPAVPVVQPSLVVQGNEVDCAATVPVTAKQVTYAWLIAGRADGVGGTTIGTGEQITLTPAQITALQTSSLVCRVTATGAMGSSVRTAALAPGALAAV